MSKLLKLAAAAAVLGFSISVFGAGVSVAQTPPNAVGKPQLVAAATAPLPKLGIGQEAKPEEIAGWDIDVRPDGQGLPAGKGTAAQGEAIFIERCAVCHGEFGQGNDRWPVLAGGIGTLKADRPEKTIGSFWPATSTVFDYVRRAMPYGNAQSLTPNETYAIVAYILQMNEVIKDPNFELNRENFASVQLPNNGGFFDDDREISEKHFWGTDVCMKDCKPEQKVSARAMVLDVTPGTKTGPKVD
jgi:S-disulfanyl-L-cysteine oxidoreductase SoxD